MDFPRCKCYTNILFNQKVTKKDQSRFEDIPNEILTEIFKQLDARELFRSFHNLNNRLNQLIQSFNYLQLCFHMNSPNVIKTNDEIFSLYVHTLVVDPWIDFSLKHFPNVRRLKLESPVPKVLEQLKANRMPFLESLSVLYTFNMYEITLLHDVIFSNGFPNLISCELLEKISLMTIKQGIEAPNIRFLKTESMDLAIFETVLSTCPNLYLLKFSMYSAKKNLTNSLLHTNLQCMVVDLMQSDWFDDDHTLSDFVARVPNLQRLEIHRRNYSRDILEHLQHYEWLASIIALHLPLLRKFKFHFHISTDASLRQIIDESVRTQIEKDFIDAHKGQYKAQLEIHRKSSS